MCGLFARHTSEGAEKWVKRERACCSLYIMKYFERQRWSKSQETLIRGQFGDNGSMNERGDVENDPISRHRCELFIRIDWCRYFYVMLRKGGKLLSKRGHFLLRRAPFSLQHPSPSSGRQEAQPQQH